MADLDLARYPLTVSVKNTPAGPLLWIDGGQTGASIPSVVLVEDGDKASHEFELSDVQLPPGTGLAIGLAKGHHRLIYSPTSIGSGASAALRPYHLVAARVDNQLNEYVLEVPEVLVGNQETVVFDFGNWDFVDSEVSAEDLPITLWEGVIIEDVLAASAAAFPVGGKKLSATRATKNNKALKRSRPKTTKVKRPRRRSSS
jgi:hypothetical protein